MNGSTTAIDVMTTHSYIPIDGVCVVGITGAARHGKDSIAQILIELVPGAERFSFSDLLSAKERIDGRMTARDPRHLQELVKTTHRPNLVSAMYHAILDRRPKLAIVTGVRKSDEVAMIKALGGVLLKVLRTERDGRIYQTADRDPNHPIEQEIAQLPADLMVAAPSGDLETLRRFAHTFAIQELRMPVRE